MCRDRKFWVLCYLGRNDEVLVKNKLKDKDFYKSKCISFMCSFNNILW